jgi:LuxR family transcriptional regulator, quorum-sensing system regulator BjaR1
MLQTSFDFEQSAFDFVEQLDRRSSANEVVDAMHEILGGYGVEFFCISGFPNPEQRFEEVMLVNRVPAEWLKIYLERQYAHVDHALRFCKRTTRPFAWEDAPYDPEREPRTAEYARGVREFGLTQGLLVPAHGPAGAEGLVWMGGTRLDLPPHHKEIVHLIALYAFDRVRYLDPSVLETAAVLTSREREVLKWIARGKSAWEIGEILNIAKRTVDTHAQATFGKLRAVNRVHAVAIAIRDGLIDV